MSSKLHPQVAELVRAQSNSPFSAPDVPTMRLLHDERNRRLGLSPPPVFRVEKVRIPRPWGGLDALVVTPRETAAPLPALIWLHGGGWVLSGASAYESLCRRIALDADVKVIAVDYRLAPEHKFPAAVEDCLATVRWTRTSSELLGIDSSRIAVGGDSAGGNLAAVIAQMCQASGEPELSFQVLVYPLTDLAGSYPSAEEFSEGYLLTRNALQWFAAQYLEPHQARTDPRVSPLHAQDVSRVAPALIVTAECDPVRDEGSAYADKLARAGVTVRYECFRGMVHPFLSFGGVLDDARKAQALIATALREALA